MSVVRPTPWSLPPAGFHYEAVEDSSLDWIAPPVGAGRCRHMSGHPLKVCGKPPVATLYRGTHRHAYDYCPEHLYGRWVEDGKVLGWRLVKDDE